ncbi:hypothetical protein ACM66B_001567 [Microbotryomycetes sp. NB124-2]
MSSASRASTPDASTDSDSAAETSQQPALDADEFTRRVQRLHELVNDNLLGQQPLGHTPAPAPAPAPACRRTNTKDNVSDQHAPLRLFSTQKQPQAVVILTAEQEWPTLADPRIRDVTEQDPALLEKRAAEIASVAVDGQSLKASAQLVRQLNSSVLASAESASSRKAFHDGNKVERRALVAPQMRHLAASPRLAFLDAVFSMPNRGTKRVNLEDAAKMSRSDIERALFPRDKRKWLNKRHPLKDVQNALLRVTPAATPARVAPSTAVEPAGVESKPKTVPKQAISAQERRQNLLAKLKRGVVRAREDGQSKARGNKRLSKKRRDEIKLKLKKLAPTGKQSKRNQKKKAKLKAKAA